MGIMPLISVVVPIYNVAPYVRKCLDSLKNQTLREIEVICIDDGSTDRSGEIADEYANDEFPIIRVIHTENRGLSAARNRGIDEARADWIMFVDSDDWVEPGFCKIPYEAAVENEAEIVIFGNYRITRLYMVKRPKRIAGFEGGLKHEEAIEVGGTIAWNKLYRRALFETIRYPDGHVYEEVATTHKLIYKATRIVRIPYYLYYYRYRRGSIINSPIGVDDLLNMSIKRYEDLREHGYPKEKAYPQLLDAALSYCGKAMSIDNSMYMEALEIVKDGSFVRLRGKAWIKKYLFSINRSFYRFIYKSVMRVKGVVLG